MPVYKPDIQKLLTNAKLRINFKCCFLLFNGKTARIWEATLCRPYVQQVKLLRAQGGCLGTKSR